MTGLGFLPVWAATMAAMMLPSIVPLLRLERAAAHSTARAVAITGGYLSMWVALGLPVLLVEALLGLGMMSIGWMAIVGAAISVEKLTPVGVGASRALAGALAAGAVLRER